MTVLPLIGPRLIPVRSCALRSFLCAFRNEGGPLVERRSHMPEVSSTGCRQEVDCPAQSVSYLSMDNKRH
jgi:hypothetical protein